MDYPNLQSLRWLCADTDITQDPYVIKLRSDPAMHADDCSQSLTSMTKNVMDQIFRVLFFDSDKKFSRQIQDRGQIGVVKIVCRFRRTQQTGSLRYIGFGFGIDHLLLISRIVR